MKTSIFSFVFHQIKIEIGHIPGTAIAETSYSAPHKLKCGRYILLGTEASDLVRHWDTAWGRDADSSMKPHLHLTPCFPLLKNPSEQQPYPTPEMHGPDRCTAKHKLVRHGFLLSHSFHVHSQPFLSPCTPLKAKWVHVSQMVAWDEHRLWHLI